MSDVIDPREGGEETIAEKRARMYREQQQAQQQQGGGRKFSLPKVSLPKVSLPKINLGGIPWKIILILLVVAAVGLGVLTFVDNLSSSPATAAKTGVKLPDPNVKEAWKKVPTSLPDLFDNLNSYSSWIGFPILIYAAAWAFKRERKAANEMGDYHIVSLAFWIFLVLSIFAEGVAATMGGPAKWLGVAVPAFLRESKTLVMVLAFLPAVAGFFKSIDGIRDFTPLSAGFFLPGAFLVWAPPTTSELRSVGLAMMVLSAAVLLVEFWLKDPKSKTRRLWSPVAGTLGFLVLLMAKDFIANGIVELISKVGRTVPPLVTQILNNYVLPLSGMLALVAGVLLGGLMAVKVAGKMIQFADKLGLGSLGSHDEFDAVLWMAILAAFKYLLLGGL